MAFEHHLRTPLLYRPLGLLCSLSFSVEHHIGIGCVVVHRSVELNLSTSSERVAYCLVLAQPLTELHDRGLIRCEVHKGVFLQHRQDIEVVGHSPIHIICTDLGTQIWRVHQEHHMGRILVLLEQLFVVARHNLNTLQIVRARLVIALANVVV